MAPNVSSGVFRALSSISCTLERFCCCSLRFGVLFVSILYLVNAALAFAGEAALYLGVLNALSSGLPPGTKLEDPRLHGGLIFLGLWMLTGCILGFIAALRRNQRAARGFYYVTFIDLILAIMIGVFSFFAGASFNALIAQVPALALNVYFVLIVRSWRVLLEQESHAGKYPGMSGGTRRDAEGATVPDVGAAGGLGENDELDVDVEDLDLDLEAAPGGTRGAGGGAGSIGVAKTSVDAKSVGSSGATAGGSASSAPVRPVKRREDDD